MTVGVLVAVTLPGLVLLLLGLAVVEHVAARLRRRGVVSRRPRSALTATGMDFMAVLTTPDKQLELDQRAREKVRRVDDARGDSDAEAAPRTVVDLDSGTARVVRP